MVDGDFMKADDNSLFLVNPLHSASTGFSFSVWEKITYETNVLLGYDTESTARRKYVVSSGVHFDVDLKSSHPGFAIYHQGSAIVAVVSTGYQVKYSILVKLTEKTP